MQSTTLRFGKGFKKPPQPLSKLSELEVYQSDFRTSFKYRGVSPLNGTKRSMSWVRLREVVQGCPRSVQGIKLHYGLVSNAWIVVVQLMEEDPTTHFLEPIADENYLFNEQAQSFRRLMDTAREALVEEYLDEVWVRRTAVVNFGQLVKPNTHGEPDPSSTIFTWHDAVQGLFDDNVDSALPLEDYYLVVNCIAVEEKFEPTHPNVEFRHGVALNVGVMSDVNGAKVLIDLVSDAASSSARSRALDYGNLCPPRCR